MGNEDSANSNCVGLEGNMCKAATYINGGEGGAGVVGGLPSVMGIGAIGRATEPALPLSNTGGNGFCGAAGHMSTYSRTSAILRRCHGLACIVSKTKKKQTGMVKHTAMVTI